MVPWKLVQITALGDLTIKSPRATMTLSYGVCMNSTKKLSLHSSFLLLGLGLLRLGRK